MGAVLNWRLAPVIVVLNLAAFNCDDLKIVAGAMIHWWRLIISSGQICSSMTFCDKYQLLDGIKASDSMISKLNYLSLYELLPHKICKNAELEKTKYE
jgi:hypothetical protein